MDMTFSEKIKNLRAERGLTLEQVAAVVGVGKSTVRKWETGDIKNMRRDKISKLSMALGVSPAYLMGWDDDAESSATKEAPVDTVDDELREYLDELRSRPEQRMLFSVTKHATKAQIEAIVKMVEEMQGNK